MGLLETTPTLIVDQVTSFLSNDFAIRDSEGTPLGHIITEGGLGSRVFLGSRQLTVIDSDETAFVYLDDVVNLGLDRFELYDTAAHELATITKEFTFFSNRLSIAMATGEELQLAGDWLDWNFTIDAPDQAIAQVARSFPGIGPALLGRSRYVVAFEPTATPDQRRATFGATIAIDLIRAKKQRNSAPAG